METTDTPSITPDAPIDYLAEAQAAHEQMLRERSIGAALIDIAQSLRRIADTAEEKRRSEIEAYDRDEWLKEKGIRK